MTRIKAPTYGATVLTRTPPAAALPDSLVRLIEEHARLMAEHNLVAAENAQLRVNTRADDDTARQADAAAAADAARTGGDTSARPNADALAARRQKAAQQTAALSDALEMVGRDLNTARNDWERTGQPAKHLATAGARLAKAGEVFTKALDEAVAALAVDDWVKGDPYDTTALVALLELDPALGQLFGARGSDLPAGVNATSAISAIVAAFTKEPARV